MCGCVWVCWEGQDRKEVVLRGGARGLEQPSNGSVGARIDSPASTCTVCWCEHPTHVMACVLVARSWIA